MAFGGRFAYPGYTTLLLAKQATSTEERDAYAGVSVDRRLPRVRLAARAGRLD